MPEVMLDRDMPEASVRQRTVRTPIVQWIGELTLNPLGFLPLWFEPCHGQCVKAKFCLLMVRCFFPGFPGFRLPLMNDRLDISGIFLKKQIKQMPHSCHSVTTFLDGSPGPGCSKLMMSLVNDSLKFTSSDMQIC